MSISIVRMLEEDLWRRFVAEHPEGSIFHSPEMFHVFERARGHQPELWAATEDGHILALLLPVCITLMGGPLRNRTTRAIVYGSVLCSPGMQGHKGLELLLGEYTAETAGTRLFTQLRNLVDLGQAQPLLQRQGFRYESQLNYLIDLDRPVEAVFDAIGRRTRKNIRHALNQRRVTVEVVNERVGVATCYELLRSTYKRAHVPLAHRSLFEAAFDVLYPLGMVRFTLARVGEAPVAVSVDLLYRDVIFGWYGGLDRAYSAHCTGELLMWDVLRWGAEHGYRVYDFGGAGRPDQEYGVRDFKAKFGGALVDYGRNTFVHSPAWMALCERVYQVARRALY